MGWERNPLDILVATPISAAELVYYEWSENMLNNWLALPQGYKIARVKFPEPVIDVTRDKAVQIAIQNGAKWLWFVDSVPSYTPVILRHKLTNDITIRPISEIAIFQGTDKEYQAVLDWEVFTGETRGGWTPINHVIRHPFSGNLVRLNTHSGLVDVSANHSVIKFGTNKGSISIKGEDVALGMKLVSPRFYHMGRWGKERKFFFGDEELAWFYGFFAAEGSVSQKGNAISVSNTKTEMLGRCEATFKRYFARELTIFESKAADATHAAQYKVGTCGKKITDFFASRFYTNARDKRVPDEILNAPENIKMAFLQGYHDGDGSLNKELVNGSRFQTITTNSQVLAMGLLYLIQTTTKQKFAIHIRDDKTTIVGATLNQPDGESLSPHEQKRDYREVKKIRHIPYTGYLYDIETENHIFAGGVGPILLHNSDILPPKDALIKLLEANKPIVGGLYVRRHNPPFNEMLRFRTDGMPGLKPIQDGEYQPGELVECDAVATGCLLIQTEVFEKMKPFEITIDGKPAHPQYFLWTEYRLPNGLSEDFAFSTRAKLQGIPVYCHTGVVCKHVGPVKFQPSFKNQLAIEFPGGG